MITGNDLRNLRATESGSQISSKVRALTLWTEKGAARMSKIVDTDAAWAFFERLEDSYFRPRETLALPQTYEQALESLLAQVKETRQVAEQRDRAVKERLWIGQKREATAMATASVAVREKNQATPRTLPAGQQRTYGDRRRERDYRRRARADRHTSAQGNRRCHAVLISRSPSGSLSDTMENPRW